MRYASVLVLLLSGGCNRTLESTRAEPSSSIAPTNSQLTANHADLRAPLPATVTALAEHQAHVFELLVGGEPLTNLPEQAVEPGAEFNIALRDQVAPPNRSAVVRFENVTATPGLPKEVVQRIVRQNFGRLRLCYKQALTRSSATQGVILLGFVINARGAIERIQAPNALNDDAFTRCVVAAVRGLRFPPPEGGKSVSVNMPISFVPPT